MLRLLRLISIAQLRTGWARACLVVGGIATGVTLIVAIQLVNASVLENVRRTIELMAGPAALEVTLGLGELGFQERVADVVRADPDVDAAIPLVRGTVGLADDPGETLDLVGVDFVNEEDWRRYGVLPTTDRRSILRAVEDPNAIVLTTAFARPRAIDLGAMLRLSTTVGVETFTVRALVADEGIATAFAGRLAVMDLASAQRVLAKEGRVDQIDVVARAGASTSDLERRLRASVPSSLTVAPPAWRAAQYESILGAFQEMLTGLSTLCLVAGVFIVYNTTSTAAAHRATMMASLRLIGADATLLFRLLMAEALVLGTLGTMLGIPVGMVLARLLVGMVGESMGAMFQLRFPAMHAATDARTLVIVGLLGVGATLFASYFAARRAARLEPLEVLRADGSATGLQLAPRRLVVLWIAIVLVSAAAIALEERYGSIVLGNLGATLWDASAIVIAVPLVTWLDRPVSRLLARLFGVEGRVAAASLFRSPTRTGVTIAAIALVLTIAITLSSMAGSMMATTIAYVTQLHGGDLVVSGVSTEGGWLEAPVTERVVAEIEAIPGVRKVETARIASGQLFRGHRIGLFAVSGGLLDPGRYPAAWYREGDPALAAAAIHAGTGVNVSTVLADDFDLHVGDRVELDTPTGVLALPVVGVVPDISSNRGSVILDRRLFSQRWGDSTVNRINVFTDATVPIETVRRRIVERLGDRYRLKVLPVREVLANHERTIDRAFAFTDAIQLLLVVVTVAGIVDLLLSAIFERRRELALWRLIGAARPSVRRAIVLESVTLGIVAAAVGMAMGLVTAWIWIRFNVRHVLGYECESHVAVASMVRYVALIAAMTLLSGYAAAWHATRPSILDGIRRD